MPNSRMPIMTSAVITGRRMNSSVMFKELSGNHLTIRPIHDRRRGREGAVSLLQPFPRSAFLRPNRAPNLFIQPDSAAAFSSSGSFLTM